MIEKEIIINGVNVAGCKFYEKNAVLYDCIEGTTSGDDECYKCKDEPNCYYKQLKRLEQENKKLKQQLEIDKNQINYFIEENEKLKKTIEKIKALNLFSLNDSREKIAEINAIINDQKESEER